jgi:hypothetical protein
MVNKGDAVHSEEWRGLPIKEQIGFRIPISIVVNITNLRNRQPVTVSEYLRLHGQNPEIKSSSGFWPRHLYHTHTNIFEATTPSLFIIENHWYSPAGTNRVDYIPEAMKRRGKLNGHPGPDNHQGSAECWPNVEPTELSRDLAETMLSRGSSLDWDTVKNVLKNVLVTSSDLIGDVNLDDDEVVEELLNAHGWEVLRTFPTV